MSATDTDAADTGATNEPATTDPAGAGDASDVADPGGQTPTGQVAVAETAEVQEHRHPTPREYVQIAVALAVLTALEVSTYYIEFGAAALPLLLGLMAIKFALVAGWFMHLRFDTRLFTRLMAAGLTLALAVYGIVLTIFAFGTGG